MILPKNGEDIPWVENLPSSHLKTLKVEEKSGRGNGEGRQ